MADTLLYLGGYSTEAAAGLNVYRLDPGSGALEHVQAVADVVNPSFLALGPQHRCLYAISEVADFGGSKSGGVAALEIDPGNGRLRLLNQQSSVGTGPCHIDIDHDGRFVLVANYGGGSVAMLPIAADGSLEEASDFRQHAGSSVDPRRQTGPHAHSINVDPTNTFAFAPDLGLDKIMCYRVDHAALKLVAHKPSWVETPPGSGPRHMAFHPDGRHAYVVTEMGNTVLAYRFDAASGQLNPLQTVSTLPAAFTGTSYGADIHLSADGRFLYASNRGHDSIAIFAVDPASGRLELKDTPTSGGEFPRNFGLDPQDRFLLSANQNSDNVVVYRRDLDTGALDPTGHQIHAAKPVCVRVVEI